MDADLQHDERLLPRMFDILKSEPIVDAVVRQSLRRAREHWHLKPMPRVAEPPRHSLRAFLPHRLGRCG